MAKNVLNYQRYEEFRSFLEDVQRGFERAANSWPNLTHRLFYAPDEALSPEAWQTFARMNTGKTIDAVWELWQPFPSGDYCNQFFGEEKWFRVLGKLVESGLEVLNRFARFRLQKGHMPDDAFFNLPEDMVFSDWIKLVYDTAEFSTPLLWSKFSAWEVPDNTSSDEMDSLMYDAWSEPNNGSPRIPLHPPVLELHLDLFNSSSEAIRCWLQTAQIVNFLNLTDDLPIKLPSTIHEKWAEAEQAASFEDAFLSKIAKPTIRPKPRYDKNARILFVGDTIIKRYSRPAIPQETLLSVFEEDGWPPRIDDPLPLKPNTNPKKRLGTTIYSLNAGLNIKSLIKFHSDGKGQGVTWRYIDG